jgi:thiol-disulfide isomerase/thioredoxin
VVEETTMKKVRRGGLVVTALALATLAAGEQQADAPAIKTVTYAELGRAIRDSKGKVVIVDFWFNACGPCLEELPKLVALQNKYRDQGLIAMTVNIDRPTEKAMALARKNLAKNNATTVNFNMSREEAKQAGVSQCPAAYIFDRDNHWVKRLTEGKVDYVDLEKDIAELLKK